MLVGQRITLELAIYKQLNETDMQETIDLLRRAIYHNDKYTADKLLVELQTTICDKVKELEHREKMLDKHILMLEGIKDELKSRVRINLN